ncbi:MAG: RNA polymerase sigma factor [Lachnospiraceae bacterium]|nr:RNA polymerase sigma factor [Lachnospiraceae bacterium]
MSFDIEEQYDKIYRYCYFKLHSAELAEDVTQETFLRYLEHDHGLTTVSALKYLYTIARNLCVDEYRKPKIESIDESIPDYTMEEKLITNLTVGTALSKLASDEQELLLLRYANEVPVSALGKIYGLSRFAIYRKITSASNKFREELRKEDYHG